MQSSEKINKCDREYTSEVTAVTVGLDDVDEK